MKKAEIQVGKKYVMKVSGKLVPVLVTNVCQYGGWYGTNTVTNRDVRIRTAGKLRREYGEPAKKRSHAQGYWYGWFTPETKTNAEVVGHITYSIIEPKMLCGAQIPAGATARDHVVGQPFMTMKFGVFCSVCEKLSAADASSQVR